MLLKSASLGHQQRLCRRYPCFQRPEEEELEANYGHNRGDLPDRHSRPQRLRGLVQLTQTSAIELLPPTQG